MTATKTNGRKHKASEEPPLDRLPPHNLDAEKAVLGSMLLDPECCDDLALILKPQDFYADANRKIYSHAMAIHNDGKRLDSLLLHDRIKAAGDLEYVGGVAYLIEVADSVPHAANAVHYAQAIRDTCRVRQVIHAATETLRTAYDGMATADDLLNEAESRVFKIREFASADKVQNFGDVLFESIASLDRDEQEAVKSLTFGLPSLDVRARVLCAGHFTVIAGRPGEGKSALAANLGRYQALTKGGAVMIASMEMTRKELAERMLCDVANVNGWMLRDNRLTREERGRLVAAFNTMSKIPLVIDDSHDMTVNHIAAQARRLKRSGKLDLLIIDYLQLITPENPGDIREQQVARISRRLKNLAKELQIPIVCLAQLNRKTESDAHAEPQVHHLRESGALEQDADNVLLVWRTGDQDRREGHIKIGKQRNGPTSTVTMIYEPEYTRFVDDVADEQGGFNF